MYRFDDAGSRLYCDFKDAFSKGQDKIKIHGKISNERVMSLYKLAIGSGLLQSIVYDAENLSIVGSPFFGDKYVSFSRLFSGQESRKNTDLFRIKSESIIDSVRTKSNGDEITQIKEVYDYIASTVRYDYSGSLQAHSAWAALMTQKAVCEGISFLISYLLNQLGIECGVIEGRHANSNGEKGNHMWNILRLRDSRFYHLDATFALSEESYIMYDYFLTNDGVISQTHIWDRAMYQECDGSFDYYKRNGLYAGSITDCRQVLKSQIRSDKDIVMLKVSEKLAGHEDIDKLVHEALQMRINWTKESAHSTYRYNQSAGVLSISFL